ncbi:YpmS family protein [Rummeliibacillus stabekisii]|uniref:YpmS family protein n=1 Tax=Rummeliibacillus stabekisii TaxID=241244 RepID=UPI00203B4CD3|nr:YpmS family protein [Rummeliibacillus stabekisii]MCM3316723.1 YpmS family protein [Rummeliibacillus stabekisii]
MNKWKIAFLLLFTLVIVAIVSFFYLITRPIDTTPNPIVKQLPNGSHLEVQTTKKDFENMANRLIESSMKTSKIPVTMEVDQDVTLNSTLTVFEMELPITMTFEPSLEEGNLLLKQKTVEVGMLDIPPNTALKLLKDSVDLPSWMVIQPKEEQIYFNLTDIDIPLGENLIGHVQAKEFNLDKNRIILDVIIPTK